MTDTLCRFYKKCEHFGKDSFTCTHGGGDYCGKYRELIHNLNKKILILTVLTIIPLLIFIFVLAIF